MGILDFKNGVRRFFENVTHTRRIDDADSELFRENQHIPWLPFVVRINFIRMHDAVDGKPVFDIGVVDRMSAAKYGSGLYDLFRAAGHLP